MSAEHFSDTQGNRELVCGATVTARVFFRQGEAWQPALDEHNNHLLLTGRVTNNLSDQTINILPDVGNKSIESDPYHSLHPISLPLTQFEHNGVEYMIEFTSHSDTPASQP